MTDWHRLSIRSDDGSEVEALGWWQYKGAVWMLDRVVDDSPHAYAYTVTDLGPADVLVLPAPSGPVEKHTWGWECGNVEATDLADADGWAAELPQHIADSRAIAAHIRGLEPVWLDPEPVVPRPGPRVFRAGDPEPGEDVRAVLDREGDLWQSSPTGWWYSSVDDVEDWATMMEFDGPLVEVILPTAVTE